MHHHKKLYGKCTSPVAPQLSLCNVYGGGNMGKVGGDAKVIVNDQN